MLQADLCMRKITRVSIHILMQNRMFSEAHVPRMKIHSGPLVE